LIAFTPLFAGIILLVGEFVLIPGNCKAMGGVICYSQAALIFGWVYSIPAALILWIAGVLMKTVFVDLFKP
jgi:hypothetical protein